jgi:hypothetical protein
MIIGRREGPMLWLRTLLFKLIVPGTVLSLAPLALLACGVGPSLKLGPARRVGLLPLGLGLQSDARPRPGRVKTTSIS